MKIEEMAKSYKDFREECGFKDPVALNEIEVAYEEGANYVLDAITECMPKTHSFNPNEVIDIITSKIKELKK